MNLATEKKRRANRQLTWDEVQSMIADVRETKRFVVFYIHPLNELCREGDDRGLAPAQCLHVLKSNYEGEREWIAKWMVHAGRCDYYNAKTYVVLCVKGRGSCP